MEQRVSLLTLGARDLDKSVAFFTRLGWRREGHSERVAFFRCGGIVVSLYPRDALAADAGVPSAGGGFEGFTLAYNTRTRAEVDATLAKAVVAGAELVKPAEDAFWGGYSGYFRDPDGHLWEVAWNPGFALDANGAISAL